MNNVPFINVAMVDDHHIVRHSIASLLNTMAGISVIMQAGDGKDLVSQMHAASLLPDVCIVDIQMPVMNGHETTTYIKKQWPHIRVLALTSLNDEYHIIKMIANGAGAYLLKNCYLHELREAIIAVNEYGYYYTKGVGKKKIQGIQNGELKNPKLTDNELRAMQYIATGRTYDDIAKTLNTTARSIEGIRDSLFKKFGVTNKIDLAMHVYRINYPNIIN